MLRDCFRCESRVQGSSCQYIEECMIGGISHFKERTKAKNRYDLIREMSDEELTKFLISFRPDVAKRIPNAEKLLSGWLSEEARGKDFMNCWFFKVGEDSGSKNALSQDVSEKENIEDLIIEDVQADDF